jgi:alkylated DNA repair dioxygenase AlkB
MLNLFDTEDGPRNILPKDGQVFHYPSFFDREESDMIFQRLTDEVQWKQEEITIYGKTMNIPRLTAWYGDTNKQYTYSGIPMEPNPWTELLLWIKECVESETGVVFTSVLLNMYRNGSDSVAWHSDDEPELGDNPTIASLSFGATRTFRFRHLENKKLIESMELQHGSLVIMQGETQHHWEHEVPKSTKNAIRGRINLTFRVIH